MSDDDKIRWYERRCKALEDLLVCYRIHKQPGEKLFDELARTKERIDDQGKWRGDTNGE